MTQTQTRAPALAVTSLLVPLDGSSYAERAVWPACRMAARVGATVHLWSAAPSPAAAEGRRLRMRVLADAIGGSWEVVVAYEPLDGIRRAGDPAGLTVPCLATHGDNRNAGLVHSVSSAVVAASEGPVLLAGPAVSPEAPTGGTVAVCVDGTLESEAVMPVAISWAAALGSDVTVLTVAEPVPESLRHPGDYPRRHGPRIDADDYVGEIARSWQDGITIRGKAIYDAVDVRSALVDEVVAIQPALVVIGTHSPHGLRRLISGNTAAAVAHGSPALVLVVPLGAFVATR
ncbi:MAG: hypothetical protein QOJ23_2977 [Actinomycetota bacterium]|nr:hypothetical protein [Actinomycetota bacterium]